MATVFNDTYEIKSMIGQGGMSTVYLAEHKRLHTRWAVKQVRKRKGMEFDFLAESNILKKLQHPMLPRIVDIFEDEDSIYIVEDYVEGITLEELLKREKKVNEALGLQWFQDLCGVLNYLHGQKPHPIIYRDLKPSNIMLQPDGTLKLIDFGIAREYKQDSRSDTTYIGTKGYAAPEQFGKAQTDARTDIYSLGVTMYHLLTGKSPYEPPYRFVPAREINEKLSIGTEYILNKCIQAEPESRYQSVDALLDDLKHIYRFDTAWKKYTKMKRLRIVIIVILLLTSIGLIAGGCVLRGKERDDQYYSLLQQASTLYLSNYDEAAAVLDEARTLFPNRAEPDRQQTYALYLNGRWQDCVEFGRKALERFEEDTQVRLIVASAQFELGDYENAAENFRFCMQDSELSADYLRDYAVSLGRMGKLDEAEDILSQLQGKGATSEVTMYVQGELLYAEEDYVSAESTFLNLLGQTADEALIRRCYLSLGDLYRTCAALERINASPIENPASKAVSVLSKGITLNALRYDSIFWETLGLAYFESYQAGDSKDTTALDRAAECFIRVIELGSEKAYLYSNLYTIYYEMGDYGKAEQALLDYETEFPGDYIPHALRGLMLITIENAKAPDLRDYGNAVSEFNVATELIRSTDDATYYHQLESLIESLRTNGWL